MSCCQGPLLPGESIFHPKYGFGVISGLSRRDRIYSTRSTPSAESESDRTEEYYDIRLAEGGTLLVPVGRAQSVGLRRLSGGIEEVKADLCSPAQSLPDGFRERAAQLRTREQRDEPGALARAVRDMLAQSRGRALSVGEKAWLEKSCQRLSTEAALVDHISLCEAEAAIAAVCAQLGVQIRTRS